MKYILCKITAPKIKNNVIPDGSGMKKIIGINIMLWNKFIIPMPISESGIDFKSRFHAAWRKAANKIRKKTETSVI